MSAAPQRWFVASSIALVATAMSFAIRGDIMSDFERLFALTKTDVGWIAGAAFWGFGLSILLGGPLCDLLGMGTLLRLAAIGHIGGTIATMAAPNAERIVRAPRPSLLWAIALVGLAASACTVLLAVTSDHIREPGVHAGLQVWGLLGFILAGVVAWWRRPESRFGLLLVLAGAVWFLSSLSSANLALPYTVGIAFDLLPAVVFLHVFLAYPSGRLEHSFERSFLAAGYFIAFGVQLAGMTLGGFGSDNLLEFVSQPEAQSRLSKVQLVALSVLCVAGGGVLALRRARQGGNRELVSGRIGELVSS